MFNKINLARLNLYLIFPNFSKKIKKMNNNQNQQEQQSQSIAKQANIYLSQERLEGRKSPEIFREPLPGAWDLNREYNPIKPKEERDRQNARFRTELDPDDVKLVNELGQLSADKLMEYIRSLHTTAISLGEEEAAQFTRAKLLKILEK